MVNKYQQPEQNHVTEAVDKLQQEVKKTKNGFSTVSVSGTVSSVLFPLRSSSSAAAATTRLIGRRAFGFAPVRLVPELCQTAAVRRPQSAVEREITPQTFIKWR